MTDPKKPADVEPLESADGTIPPENWDNDQRFTGDVDKSPGSHFNQLFGPKTDNKKPTP